MPWLVVDPMVGLRPCNQLPNPAGPQGIERLRRPHRAPDGPAPDPRGRDQDLPDHADFRAGDDSRLSSKNTRSDRTDVDGPGRRRSGAFRSPSIHVLETGSGHTFSGTVIGDTVM